MGFGLWLFLTNVLINVKDVMYYVDSDSDLFAISHPHLPCKLLSMLYNNQGSERSSNLTFTKFLSTVKMITKSNWTTRWNAYIVFNWYGYIEILIVLGKGKFDVVFNNILIVDRCKLNMTLYSLYVVFVTVYCQNKIPIKLKFMKHTCMNKN